PVHRRDDEGNCYEGTDTNHVDHVERCSLPEADPSYEPILRSAGHVAVHGYDRNSSRLDRSAGTLSQRIINALEQPIVRCAAAIRSMCGYSVLPTESSGTGVEKEPV